MELFRILNPHRAASFTCTYHFASRYASATSARTGLHCPATIVPRPDVLVRLKQHEIDLWREQAGQHDRSANVEAHAEARRLDLVVVAGAEVNCDTGEEHDARRVHGEADVLCFVEVFGDFAGLESVNGTEWNEEDDENQRNHEAVAGSLAGQHCLKGRWVDLANIGRIVNKPCDRHGQLN